MPERTVITEATQIGVESTPGTAVPATRRLRSVSFNLDPEFNARIFRPSGNKFPSIAAPGKEWVGGDLEGAGDYNEIVYPLAGILGPPVTTTPSGATTARQHVFEVLPAALQDPMTMTVEKGSAVRAERSSYVAVNEFGVTINRDEITLDGSIMGRRLEDGATLTAGATAVPLQPILPQHVSVYFDPTFAAIGATKLLRVLEVAHSLGDRFGSLWPLDAAQESYVTLYEVEPSAEATLTQVADAAGMSHLARARSGATGYLRIEAIGPIIEAAIAYTYRIDLPVKVTDFGYGDSDGLKTVEWTFGWFDDADAGNAGEITVINTVNAL